MSRLIPLFQPKLLKNSVRAYSFPLDLSDRHALLNRWSDRIQSGTLDKIKEVSLHGDFLRDIFQTILGYRSVMSGSGETWDIHAEATIAARGGAADAAIGFFSDPPDGQKLTGRIIAPIELKGSKTNLDKAGSRQESAVDQGWRYANHTAGCKWVIVSNYRELRLYHVDKTYASAQVFELEKLADLEQFKQFFFLLYRKNFLPSTADQESRIDRLLQESDATEAIVTEELYRQYKALRLELTQHFQRVSKLRRKNRDLILVEKAQKVLDRILFIAFCEDRGLLPRQTIRKAHDHHDPYYPRPIWDNYKAVFRWVNEGNPDDPPIPEYNGGLFRHDPLLDEELTVNDSLCSAMNGLTQYDYADEVSVDVLGRIFEQSVTDLEELRSLAQDETYNAKQGQRKKQGVFYTPAYITRYIVGVTVGGYLERRKVAVLGRSELESSADWQTYLDEVLKPLTVCDPACGSGAFLIAAFDFLVQDYRQAYLYLDQEFDQAGVYRQILQGNLYGVDLSSESVEITKLSLWLQTAQKGKKLADLDGNIRQGNSLIADRKVDPLALDWGAAFPGVMNAGGFDVVIGNPPYVRQEYIAPFKPYLQEHYATYDGVADLYTYFYEKGVNLLKSGGMLSYIVTNKWMRAGYGEGLRGFFRERVVMEEIIDFGHAPIFPDADTFPCIIVARREESPNPDHPVTICPVPREDLPQINLPQYVTQSGYPVPWSRFSEQAWSLEPPDVDHLMDKIRAVGVPLKEFAGVKPYRGVLTGFNEAFLIDNDTKNKLIQADPKSAEIIKPYLRGQDIKRWSPEWQNLWIILIQSSANKSWKWSSAKSLEEAEGIFKGNYPQLYDHLIQFKKKLKKRSDQGKYWWELRACAYYDSFENSKLFYQVIQTLPQYAFDESGCYGNDKTFILPCSDFYLVACLNSPLIWWYSHRYFTRMLSGSISPMGYLFETLPIAPPTPEIRAQVEPHVAELIELTQQNQQSHRDLINWFRTEHNIAKPGRKLEDFSQLSEDDFIKELKKRQPKGSSFGPTARRHALEAYNDLAPAIQTRNSAIAHLEQELNDLINQAYQLTPDEIALMWRTAPPRMPIAPPPP
ncbi:Eco57I restriction-modification methylase domain-containing protein [Spirulina major]|uniref:Eco57I restriction-modification methylase domain-containing protein n=1 Tax=Spirulina major TaxID=270636 RepID=UPI0009342FFC|nr:DNA methyltransferase [Spirulina major]